MHGPKEIIEEAGSLPVEERAFIIDSLLRTMNAPDEAIDQEWLTIAKQRRDDLRFGRVEPVPGNEVFDSIRKRLGQ